MDITGGWGTGGWGTEWKRLTQAKHYSTPFWAGGLFLQAF